MSCPSVSILVPIYNVEKYLRQCLASLVGQSLSDIEIICINDGSTDGSLRIIQDFMAKDKRIVLIDKSNSGYGDSMNQGLKKARGKYIGIVESDDWVDPEYFRTMFLLAEYHRVDVVRSNYFKNKAGRDELVNIVPLESVARVIDPHTHTFIFYQAPAIWSALYRRDFLTDHEIAFLPTPGASYQDTSFNFKVWASTHRAYFTPEAFLHYRIDNESSSVNSLGKVMNTNIEYAEIERYLKDHSLWAEFAPMVMATKTGAYYWNAYRLAGKFVREFITKSRSEYISAAEDGFLLQEYFQSPVQWRFAHHFAHYSPFKMMVWVRFRRFWSKLRSHLVATFKRLRPSLVKQNELSRLLGIIELQNRAIEQRLRKELNV